MCPAGLVRATGQKAFCPVAMAHFGLSRFDINKILRTADEDRVASRAAKSWSGLRLHNVVVFLQDADFVRQGYGSLEVMLARCCDDPAATITLRPCGSAAGFGTDRPRTHPHRLSLRSAPGQPETGRTSADDSLTRQTERAMQFGSLPEVDVALMPGVNVANAFVCAASTP